MYFTLVRKEGRKEGSQGVVGSLSTVKTFFQSKRKCRSELRVSISSSSVWTLEATKVGTKSKPAADAQAQAQAQAAAPPPPAQHQILGAPVAVEPQNRTNRSRLECAVEARIRVSITARIQSQSNHE
ncbi:hypothetical protein AXG93_2891s1060 [Marchantia polymorpha subsp. ruderalis]|uniref:Uncharacterized protein n=1 Tax=Marchantia polymorpha subsp. ruderalis TaxID=1480154 RepID=A0A176WNC5_MARPO|nr:hypothetical protein AXG93_2891s1060 [Marchantia polymorpha subsp. ruderalis]